MSILSTKIKDQRIGAFSLIQRKKGLAALSQREICKEKLNALQRLCFFVSGRLRTCGSVHCKGISCAVPGRGALAKKNQAFATLVFFCFTFAYESELSTRM
jgi:hypothetical protein